MSAAGSLGVVSFLAEEMAIALAAAYGGIRSPRLALAEFGVTAPQAVIDATALVDAYEVARSPALGPLHDANALAIAIDDVGAIGGTTAALAAGLATAIELIGALGPALAAAAPARRLS